MKFCQEKPDNNLYVKFVSLVPYLETEDSGSRHLENKKWS
jgi:hypothetical protein